jgi:hypothetical protein
MAVRLVSSHSICQRAAREIKKRLSLGDQALLVFAALIERRYSAYNEG